MKNKTVLITGATSGIGYEFSKLFAKNSHDLVLVARNRERLERLAEELVRDHHVSVLVVPKDLSLPTSPKEIFEELESKSVTVDVLINNAGFNEYGPFTETDIEKEVQMIQLNITSLTVLTKLFLRGMVARNSGRILNVGSTGSFVPGPLNSVYCATKAYVLSLSEAIAEELKGTGVIVTTLCPGATKTEFAQRAGMEDVKLFRGNTMEAKQVAEIGYAALMRGKTTVVAGCSNTLLIFSLRFIPRQIITRMVKGMMRRDR